MKARRAAMIVAMAAVAGVSEASLAQPAGETAAKECAACVRLEPIGTSFTTGEGSGTYKTIYSVVVGDPETGERLAGIWTPQYGMYGLDAVLWIRETPDDVTRWRKISLRRPRSPADIVLFASRPEAFRDEVRGGASILPGPFSGLHPVELATLDHVVSYAAGGTRALLKVGITERDAAALIGSVQVGADASFEATRRALPLSHDAAPDKNERPARGGCAMTSDPTSPGFHCQCATSLLTQRPSHREGHPRRHHMITGRSSEVRGAATGLVTVVFALVVVVSAAGAQGPSVYQATLEEANQKTPEVSTDDLKRILASGSAVVLDTRPHLEYAMSHIPGARNVAPKAGVSMSMYVSDVAEVQRLVGGDKTKPLILYCNGPFCGKSKRLSEELLAAGFTSVRRYQLGIPVWRALVGLTEIELEAVQQVFQKDRTAVFLDARGPDEFGAGSLPGARSIPQGSVQPGKDVGEVRKAKDDGRLPMEDHNTRIIVFGRDAAQARALAEAIVREAFHNVSYFPGTFDALRSAVK